MSSRRFRIGAAAVLTALGSGVACGSLEEGAIVIVDGDGQGGGGASGNSGGSTSGTGNGSSGESTAGSDGEGAAAGESSGGSAGSSQGGTSGSNGQGGDGGTPPIVDGPPTVVTVTPENDATGVATDLASVTIELSEPIDAASVTATSVRLFQGEAEVPGQRTSSGETITFTPESALDILAPYTVELTTDVKDAGGDALAAPFSSSFTTADGTWREKSDYSAAAEQALLTPAVAMNDSGDVLVAFVRPSTDPLLNAVVTRWYRRGSGWQAPQTISSPNADGRNVAVAVNNLGNAIALYAQNGQYWVRRNTDGVWQAPIKIGDAGQYFAYFNGQVRLTDSGLAVFTYTLTVNSTNNKAGYSLPNGDVSAAFALGPYSSANGVNMAANSQGRAFATYRTTNGTGGENMVRFSRFNPDDNTWSDPTAALPSSIGDFQPADVAVNEAGEAMAIWRRTPSNDAVASYFRVASGWSEPVVLDKLAGAVGISKESIASDGKDFVAAWTQTVSASLDNAYSSRFDTTTQTWSEPVLLSNGNSSVNTPLLTLGVDRRGNALVAWVQGQATAYRGWYNRYDAIAGAWTGAANAPDATSALTHVGLAVAGNGPAFGIWTKGVTSDFEFWGAAFE